MESRPHLQAKPAHLSHDGARAADAASGPVEGREEPVAGGVVPQDSSMRVRNRPNISAGKPIG
jgi:hypothetical protein